jgi:hypothetical protein
VPIARVLSRRGELPLKHCPNTPTSPKTPQLPTKHPNFPPNTLTSPQTFKQLACVLAEPSIHWAVLEFPPKTKNPASAAPAVNLSGYPCMAVSLTRLDYCYLVCNPPLYMAVNLTCLHCVCLLRRNNILSGYPCMAVSLTQWPSCDCLSDHCSDCITL